MGFRKLNDHEVEALLGAKPDKKGEAFKEILATYYDRHEEASALSIDVDSEYNDSSYDNKVEYVAVIGRDGGELHPKPGMEREARKALRQQIESKDLIKAETYEVMEQVIIRLGPTPELYIKE